MKIIEQSHEILHMDGLDLIERAGRTCYKSEEQAHTCKAGEDRLEVCKLIDLEEGPCWSDSCEHNSAFKFVRMLIKRGHEAMIEHGGATVKFITNRGVTHELVRHRVASFGQESTRYVNYGGKEMEFIRPVWCPVGLLGTWSSRREYYEVKDLEEADLYFADACDDAAKWYDTLLNEGWRPEQAREVLPNSLKTEIVVTANYREWRHIFKLRAIGTTGKPHPQMQALMLPVLEEFKAKLPALFGDLTA